MKHQNRRTFLSKLGLISGLGLTAKTLMGNPNLEFDSQTQEQEGSKKFFKISLAQWSLHRELFDKKLDNLDFAIKAKNDFQISAVEYVNQFFFDKANDTAYLSEMKKRCDDNGVRSVLIMCDGEGSMADTDEAKRMKAVENHFKWADAAKFLGCHSIRVNCHGEGTPEELAKTGADGLRKLCEYGKKVGINIIVENHGGISSNGKWLSSVIKSVGMDNCGTLPDFGNFCLKRDEKGGCAESYDRYEGVKELMPFAKGVSAKSHDFNQAGDCIETNFKKMLGIVKAAGYKGFVGIEYEGDKLSEYDGIRATKKLLDKIGA